MKKKIKALNLGVLLTIVAVMTIQIAQAQTTDPSTSIEDANIALNQAFSKVQALENAGQDVSGLITRLNIAGELLVQAENSYKSGDLTDVTNKANNAALAAVQVSSSANTMLRTYDESQNVLPTVAFSAVGIIVTIIVLALIWRWQKRNYYKNILKLKPEVTDYPT